MSLDAICFLFLKSNYFFSSIRINPNIADHLVELHESFEIAYSLMRQLNPNYSVIELFLSMIDYYVVPTMWL